MIEQNYSNNDRLAEVYNKHYPQICIVWPLAWKHDVNGDWNIKCNLAEMNESFAVGPAFRK